MKSKSSPRTNDAFGILIHDFQKSLKFGISKRRRNDW
jgi:hypothetical protein